MASKRISQLPPALSVSGNSLLAIVNNNVTEKVTISQLPLGITSVNNLGDGASLGFVSQNELRLKTLVAGTGLSFTTSFNSITLNTVFNVNNVGSGTSLINTFTNPNLVLKSITGSGNITITDNTTSINIASTPLTTSNTGSGTSFINSFTNNNLAIKSITGSGSVTVTDNTTSIDITSVPVTSSTTGSGTSFINSFTNSNLALKSITGSGSVTVTDNTTSINIASTPVTASSSGSGTSLIDSFTNSNLALKSITGSNGIIITNNTTSIDIANTNNINFAQILAIGMLKC